MNPLILSITYDHGTGLFEAKLPNGARFTFSRSNISGKLENNLDLYRRAVIGQLAGKQLRPTYDKKEERKRLKAETAGKEVTVVGVAKRPKINLNDLQLEEDF